MVSVRDLFVILEFHNNKEKYPKMSLFFWKWVIRFSKQKVLQKKSWLKKKMELKIEQSLLFLKYNFFFKRPVSEELVGSYSSQETEGENYIPIKELKKKKENCVKTQEEILTECVSLSKLYFKDPTTRKKLIF